MGLQDPKKVSLGGRGADSLRTKAADTQRGLGAGFCQPGDF